MDITLKIHQGTGKLSGEGLCRTCQYGMIRETKNDEQAFCMYAGGSAVSSFVKGRILTCNQYMNRSLPTLYEMQQIAWTLGTNKGGRAVGFKPPKRRDEDDAPAPGF